MNMKTVIKKSKDRNEYILTEDRLWIRDFTKRVPSLDINDLIKNEEYNLLANNESVNTRLHIASIDAEKVFSSKVLIVSDGYNFQNNVKLLTSLPKDVKIIGVNGVLNKWPNNVRMDYYIVNNPYPECMSYLGELRVPRIISSIRTYPPFLANLRRRNVLMFKYIPTPNKKFGSLDAVYTVDDYRNPICASIFLANRFGANKIGLFCCDEAFEDKKPEAELLPNGLYTYPQHLKATNIINGMLYWLKQSNISVGDASNGPKLSNAEYINDIGKFFGVSKST